MFLYYILERDIFGIKAILPRGKNKTIFLHTCIYTTSEYIQFILETFSCSSLSRESNQYATFACAFHAVYQEQGKLRKT